MIITFLFAIVTGVQDVPLEPINRVEAPLQFSVTHDGLIGDSLNGRVYVMLTEGRFPRMSGPDWFDPEPFFAIDVEEWQAEMPLIFAENVDAMDGPPSSIADAKWKAVAVFRPQNDFSDLASPRWIVWRSRFV